jgi:hypothetical protein
MLNCPLTLIFSPTFRAKRLKKACDLLGSSVVKRLVGFVLFLLGANRKDVARFIRMPFGTFLSLLIRIDAIGLSGFADRRKSSPPTPQVQMQRPAITLRVNNRSVCLESSAENHSIDIRPENSLQAKVVLLTFLDNGLLSSKDTAEALGFSQRHTRALNSRLRENDAGALMDRRVGQLKDYRFTPQIKAEIVQQFAANAISGARTSSRVIAEQIAQRCGLQLSDRSLRSHMRKFGLPNIVQSLPQLVETLKKTSQDNSLGQR